MFIEIMRGELKGARGFLIEDVRGGSKTCKCTVYKMGVEYTLDHRPTDPFREIEKHETIANDTKKVYNKVTKGGYDA